MARSLCIEPGCSLPVVGRSLCSKHYMRSRANGTAPGPRCKLRNCNRSVSARGYCYAHYRRKKRGKSVRAPLRCPPRAQPLKCSVDVCDRAAVARGWCSGHHRRWSKGKPLGGPIRSFYQGGRRPGSTVTRHGYVAIYEPGNPNASSGGYVLAHRKAMAAKIGRPLLAEETVHHLNGNRADNGIENLELWSSSHSSGQRVADKVAWAKELLRLYEPSALRRTRVSSTSTTPRTCRRPRR